ncbi:DUF300-domain-containing protein [Ramaria rubella]|nr:DUF300-domain-containing protein [Ramaria rubella]
MVATCPDDNSENNDQSSFWDSSGIHWDQHRIGWAIAGGCAVLTVLITMYSVFSHARNYHNRNEQRQILRILYMPAIYAIISFFSYRFFHDYTYYSLIEVVYEAVTLSAFMLLLVEYVAATATGDKAENALLRKDKQPLPFPFCFWRFRPTKAYFMYTVKWSVMQYVIIRPAVSVAGIITQALGVLCTQSYSPQFAQVYITAIDFISISVALYGLILFYSLTHSELEGRRPLAKFLCIKGIVMLTFYQEFVFSTLQKYNVIKATEFWTATNVTDGLTALATDIEMVFFSLFMLWAYRASEYSDPALVKTNVFWPLVDSLNFSDFASEIWSSLRFFIAYALRRPNTHTPKPGLSSSSTTTSQRANFDEAFGLWTPSSRVGDIHRPIVHDPEEVQGLRMYGDVTQQGGVSGKNDWQSGGGDYGYGAGAAIPMHALPDDHVNDEDLEYSAQPRQVDY